MKKYVILIFAVFLSLFAIYTFIADYPLLPAFFMSLILTGAFNIFCFLLYTLVAVCGACFEKSEFELETTREMELKNSNENEIVVIQNPNHISIGIACQ
tara:strand:+ start:975 stop:1271 length:297 start_codon:yes stop_codon:yes gene_type:complete